jgi:hypothetical protein
MTRIRGHEFFQTLCNFEVVLDYDADAIIVKEAQQGCLFSEPKCQPFELSLIEHRLMTPHATIDRTKRKKMQLTGPWRTERLQALSHQKPRRL